MSLGEVPRDGSLSTALCTQCGLCCTGALHDYAVLDPDEIDHARNLGLTLRSKGRPGFALPCPRLSGTCCSIYGDRPSVCGRFECALLERVEAGSITLDAATTVVTEARELADAVLVQLPTGMTIPAARDLNEAHDLAGRAATPPAQMQLRLAITALSLLLDRHFRKASEGPLLFLDTVDDKRPIAEMK